MKIVIIIISGMTAFAITAGGSMGVAFIATKGVMPDKVVWAAAICLGIVASAKDTRSLLRLPPVSSGSGNTEYFRKPTTQDSVTKPNP